jgi:protein-arginine kinase activator protein McsA
MMKDEFIKRCNKIHRDRFDYSLIDLDDIRYISKIPIICNIHGIFKQQARMHLSGQGCPQCARNKNAKNRTKWTIAHFIEEASKVHKNKYSYEKVILPSKNRKVTITCPIHGDFDQLFSSHLRGTGCPNCGHENISRSLSMTQEKFILRAKKIHGNLYNYDKVKYVNGNTSVTIVCEKHGDFNQKPRQHLAGQGCPECGKNKCVPHKMLHKDFIQRVKDIYGNKYDYPEEYKGSQTKIKIICREHGEFYQMPSCLWRGIGCPKCGNKKKGAPWGFIEFLQRARQLHGDKYEYVEYSFVRMRDMVNIICPTHGEFSQVAQAHIAGQGCPKCGNTFSKGELEITEWLTSLGFHVVQRIRSILSSGKELDIYIPDFKLAIEYNGLYWHSSRSSDDKEFIKNRHIIKTNECCSLGIRLIQLWDSEWNTKKDICKEIILFALGRISRKIYARNCTVKYLSATEASAFLNQNHIQGGCKSTVRLGLFQKDELVGIQCYQAPNQGGQSGSSWLLIRTAFLKETQVIGGISKLFKFFIAEINPEKVVDYTDRRLFTASGHYHLEFTQECITPPGSSLTNGVELFSRRHYRHVGKRHFKYKMPWDDSLTDTENLANNGWYWVWDCGKIKNVWKQTD